MRLFQMSTPSGRRSLIVVAGEGLLGTALSTRLRRLGPEAEHHRSTDWSAEPSALGADLSSMVTLLTDAEALPVELFWTAGESGMQLPDFDETAHRTVFAGRLASISNAAEANGSPTRVHLASSAGALGPPTPSLRVPDQHSPYAERKRIEEEATLALSERNRIHRITSAYGAPTAGGRGGIIGLLLQNALLGRETQLFARSSTMRNYVHHHDVAEAMIRSLDADTDSHLLLASDRSHAMSEVLAEVSRVVRRAVPVIHRPPANDHDMVFDPAASSRLLPQRSLAAGVRSTYDSLLSR